MGSSAQLAPADAYDQIFRLERNLLAASNAKGPFDPAVRRLRTSIRDGYEALILRDLAFNEVFEVEHALWRLHYREIEGFRVRIRKFNAMLKAPSVEKAAVGEGSSRKRKKDNKEEPLRRALTSFKSFLAEATGFFHGLFIKLRLQHGVTVDRFLCVGEPSEDFARCMAVCHRILIYLGDLARYKEFYAVLDPLTRDWRVAAAYYKQAAVLWPCSGNPYHQLAVLSTYRGKTSTALYLYCRSLGAKASFETAWDNVVPLFEKNRQQLQQTYPLHENGSDKEGLMAMFLSCFIELVRLLLIQPSADELDVVFYATEKKLQQFFDIDVDSAENSVTTDKLTCNTPIALQLIVILVFCMHHITGQENLENQVHILTSALVFSFKFTSMLTRVAKAEEIWSAYAVAVLLVEWLASQSQCLQIIQKDEVAASGFSEFCEGVIALDASLLTKFTVDEPSDDDVFGTIGTAQMEDHDLFGFVPFESVHLSLDFKIQPVRYGVHDLGTFSCWKRRYTEALEKACKISGQGNANFLCKSQGINKQKMTQEESAPAINPTVSLKEWIDKTFFSTEVCPDPMHMKRIHLLDNMTDVNLHDNALSMVRIPEIVARECLSHSDINAESLCSDASEKLKAHSGEQSSETQKMVTTGAIVQFNVVPADIGGVMAEAADSRITKDACENSEMSPASVVRHSPIKTNGNLLGAAAKGVDVTTSELQRDFIMISSSTNVAPLDALTHVKPNWSLDSIVNPSVRRSMKAAFRNKMQQMRYDGHFTWNNRTYESANPFVQRLKSLSEL